MAPNTDSGLVATGASWCITHGSTACAGRAWDACRFRQLFYFENPADEDTLAWSDPPAEPTPLFRYWSVLVVLAGLTSGKGWGITDTGWALFTAWVSSDGSEASQ